MADSVGVYQSENRDIVAA